MSNLTTIKYKKYRNKKTHDIVEGRFRKTEGHRRCFLDVKVGTMDVVNTTLFHTKKEFKQQFEEVKDESYRTTDDSLADCAAKMLLKLHEKGLVSFNNQK